MCQALYNVLVFPPAISALLFTFCYEWRSLYVCLFKKDNLFIHVHILAIHLSRMIQTNHESIYHICIIFRITKNSRQWQNVFFPSKFEYRALHIICLMIGLYTALKLLKVIIFSELHVNTGVYIYLYAREYFEFKI